MLLRGLLKKMQGRNYLDDREAVAVFSAEAGRGLSQWFREQWQIGLPLPSEPVTGGEQ